MKKTVMSVLCVVSIVALGVDSAQAGRKHRGKPFVAINEMIIEVKGAVSTLQEQVELLLASSENMDERLTSLEQAYFSIEEQSATLHVLIDNNLNTLDDIQTEIDFLTTDVDALKAQVANNSGDIASLQEAILAKEALIASLQAAINLANQDIIDLNTSLSVQIDNNADKIALLESQLAVLEADLAMKQNLVNGLCPNGEAIQQILEDGSVICGAAGGGVSGQLETVYSYAQLHAGTNQSVLGVARCPEGYNITGAGYGSAYNWTVHGVYPEVDVQRNLQYAVVEATNNGVYDDIVPVATCSRIAP